MHGRQSKTDRQSFPVGHAGPAVILVPRALPLRRRSMSHPLHLSSPYPAGRHRSSPGRTRSRRCAAPARPDVPTQEEFDELQAQVRQ
jgi:hypothetical protein